MDSALSDTVPFFPVFFFVVVFVSPVDEVFPPAAFVFDEVFFATVFLLVFFLVFFPATDFWDGAFFFVFFLAADFADFFLVVFFLLTARPAFFRDPALVFAFLDEVLRVDATLAERLADCRFVADFFEEVFFAAVFRLLFRTRPADVLFFFVATNGVPQPAASRGRLP